MGYTEESLSEKGAAIQSQLWGEAVLKGGGGGVAGAALAPEFFQLVRQFCFGMFWSRPNLAIRDRSLCTVAQLAALGRTEELKAHLAGALNLGITREELIEVLMQTACYAGVPLAVGALNAAADVLQGQIHALLAVGEHPVLQQSLEHATADGLVIRRLDTDQDQQAHAYGADRMALNLDAGAADPLQQRLHSASWGRSSSWRAI